jgi:hypothetical protein
VEDAQPIAREQVGALAHVEPERAMALLRAAAGADARVAVAEAWHEAAEAPTAARAFDLVAPVDREAEPAQDGAARAGWDSGPD